MDTQTTDQTISDQEFADLLDVDRTCIGRHRDELPTPTLRKTGKVGRPAKQHSLAAIAALVLIRTAHLSDAQCRAIAAFRLRESQQ